MITEEQDTLPILNQKKKNVNFHPFDLGPTLKRLQCLNSISNVHILKSNVLMTEDPNNSLLVGAWLWSSSILFLFIKESFQKVNAENIWYFTYVGYVVRSLQKVSTKKYLNCRFLWICSHNGDLGKFSLEKKKKSVNFPTFVPDPPPPLKSVKLNNFFFTHQLKHILVKILFKRIYFFT